MRIVHDFTAAFLCVLSFATLFKSLTLAVTICPCRVRATGFGLVVGVGVIGGVIGKLLGEYNDNTIIFFCLSSVLSNVILKRTKKIEILNKDCNDIYEILESKCRHNIITVNNPSFYSEGRESSVKHVSIIELRSEFESCSDLLTPRAVCEHYIDLPVEDTMDELGEIESIRVFRNGFISTKGSDSKGQYVVEGHIENFKYFRFTKKRNDILEVIYTGERINNFLIGRWKDHAQEGEFKWLLQMTKWRGTVVVKNVRKPVTWLISMYKDTVVGVLLSTEGFKILKGNIKEHGKLAMQIIDSHGKVLEFEGEIKNNRIEVKHEDKDTILLTLTQAS